MDEYSIKLGHNMRSMRILRGISVTDIASKLDVSEDTIRKWERGEREPGMKNIIAYAVILECSTQALIDGLDPRSASNESGKEIRLLSPTSNQVMRWVSSEWEGDADALITAFGYYAAVPPDYRKHAMMELLERKDEAVRDGAMTEDDIPDCVKAGLPHLQNSLGGLYIEK